MSQNEIIEKAKKRVRDKKQFYSHFYAFCFVTTILLVINFVFASGTWFFMLPIVGWGMAVLGHYLNVFGLPSFKSKEWESEQFELELEKIKKEDLWSSTNDQGSKNTEEQLELKEFIQLENDYDENDLV
ncbi:MAG: 2TM domain-containing protein [Bacteroidota bacterium]